MSLFFCQRTDSTSKREKTSGGGGQSGRHGEQGADPDRSAYFDRPCLNLDQGHVTLLGDQLPNETAMGLDPA
jgi:hypothetical protein